MSYRLRHETPASLAVTAAGAYHRLVALVGPAEAQALFGRVVTELGRLARATPVAGDITPEPTWTPADITLTASPVDNSLGLT